jgi:hypothetical protein
MRGTTLVHFRALCPLTPGTSLLFIKKLKVVFHCFPQQFSPATVSLKNVAITYSRLCDNAIIYNLMTPVNYFVDCLGVNK